MQLTFHLPTKANKQHYLKYRWHFLAIFILIMATVLQDFIFSIVKNTGFYFSESLLYNLYWCFILPLHFLGLRLFSSVKRIAPPLQIAAAILSALLLTFLHTFLFTCFFVGVSAIIYASGHHFSTIFYSALSSYFYITIIIYAILPFVEEALLPTTKPETHKVNFLTIKLSSKTKIIDIQSIKFISTSKPYSILYTDDRKYTDSRSLKSFEKILNNDVLVRVHRSHIINKTQVKEMHSRKNGDYDALLIGGELIRCSRHYRSAWEGLLG